MNNLVPVQRPDRNGKLVTRHVRADKAVAPSRTLPQPLPVTVPADANSPVSPEEYAESLGIIESRISKHFSRKNMRGNLAKMSLMTPESFREVVDEFRTKSRYHADLLAVPLSLPPKDEDGFNRSMLVNLSLMQTIAELNPDSRGKKGNHSTEEGEHLWFSVQRSRNGYRSPITVKTFKAVAVAIWVTDRTRLGPIRMRDEIDNLEYIGDNLDAVMAHHKIIGERGSIDRDFIKSVITTKAPAISEGIL